jgi:hypothetical protein
LRRHPGPARGDGVQGHCRKNRMQQSRPYSYFGGTMELYPNGRRPLAALPARSATAR